MERMYISSEMMLTGYLRLSAIVQGRYFEHKYNGYRKREAMKLFRSAIRAELEQDFVEQR